jgi:hypothetical protein
MGDRVLVAIISVVVAVLAGLVAAWAPTISLDMHHEPPATTWCAPPVPPRGC